MFANANTAKEATVDLFITRLEQQCFKTDGSLTKEFHSSATNALSGPTTSAAFAVMSHDHELIPGGLSHQGTGVGSTSPSASSSNLERILDRYHTVAEQSRTVFWEVDTEGCFTYVSHVSGIVW